jgi:hypothetical protein
MIIAEQATEAYAPYHTTRLATDCSLVGNASVVETLMIALSMIREDVPVEREELCPTHAYLAALWSRFQGVETAEIFNQTGSCESPLWMIKLLLCMAVRMSMVGMLA